MKAETGIIQEGAVAKNENSTDIAIINTDSILPESPNADNQADPVEELQPLKVDHARELEQLMYYGKLSKQNAMELYKPEERAE